MEWNLTAGEHHLRFDAGLMNITINVSGRVRLSVRSMLENPGGGLPSGLGFLGRFIEITLDNESALVSLTLVFSYSDDEVARAGLDESTLAVYYWDESSGSWVRIEGSVVDTVANTVTVTVDHITYFAIVGSTGREEVCSVFGSSGEYRFSRSWCWGCSPASVYGCRFDPSEKENVNSSFSFSLLVLPFLFCNFFNLEGVSVG
ncbi:MAG: hypothetical protein QXZ24_06895 [Candidatus Jordarchaeales archaeon]